MKGALGNLMRQAQQIQENVQKLQEELANMEITGESGAGLVKVTLNGKHQARRVELSPDVMDEDADVIGDLVAAAINDAVSRVETATREKMAEATGGMQLPPGINLPM